MNDRLPGFGAGTQCQSLGARLVILPDEPTFNYVNRSLRLTGGVDRKRAITKLFGNPSVQVERPLHAGFARFTEKLLSAESLDGDYLCEAHTMLGLFKPFAPPERYERTLECAKGDRATGIFEMIGARPSGVFRDSPACCLTCTEIDQKEFRPPHYRRTHLVTACQVCQEHGTALTTSCESCGASLRFTNLPSLACQNCGEALRPGRLDSTPCSDSKLLQKLAQFIHACLNGSLIAADEAVRLQILRDRIQNTHKCRSGVLGGNLATLVCRAYGVQLLEKLSLLPTREPTLGWPALLLYGRHLASDPIANCLLLAMIFESTEAYNDAVAHTAHSNENAEKKPKALTGCQSITRAILKDVLQPALLNEVAARYGIPHDNLCKWVAAYPGLSRRRKLSGSRILLRRSKKAILCHQAKNPGQSRSQVAAVLRSEVPYVLRNDQSWLNEHLPPQEGLTGATAKNRVPPRSEEDKALAEVLYQAVDAEKKALARPRRFTEMRIVGMSGLRSMPIRERSKFPATMNAIAELTENVEDYYRRCLNWAAKDLVRCRGRCDHLIELFVHAGVALGCVRSLEAHARSLITRSS